MKRLLLVIVLILAGIAQPSFAQMPKAQGNELVLTGAVTFERGTTVLTPAGKLALQEVKAYLDAKTYITTMRIEGHVFGEADAQMLSEGRAINVARELVKAGIDCKRLIVVGFGSTKPATEQGDNSRIVFVNAALRGHPIGGLPLGGGGEVAIEPCAH